MTITLFNTLTRKKEAFVPISKNQVTFYVCGVTVYDFCHVGHARAYVVFDVIRRYLENTGYEVKFVQNFTDVDDKIIARANEQNVAYDTLAQTYIDEYFKDMDALNIERATAYPRATAFIENMQDIITKLVQDGTAYTLGGDVYFNVDNVKDYGKLSKKVMEDLIAGMRVETVHGKKNPLDFVLWKAAKPGEPSWDSPWGKGRPGWHIECSAMSMSELGATIDIHGGGEDLIFPHHENEIAQSESYSESPFANYWVHNGFVNINDEKMSKSKKNFFTIRDILTEVSGEALRFFLLRVHYRKPLNFSLDGIKEAAVALEKLHKTIINFPPENDSEDDSQELKEFEKRFHEALSDDFNFAEGVGILFELNHWINKSGKGSSLLLKLGQIIGLFFDIKKEDNLPEGASDLIQARADARKNKDFAKADALRQQLLDEFSVEIEDMPGFEVRWSIRKY